MHYLTSSPPTPSPIQSTPATLPLPSPPADAPELQEQILRVGESIWRRMQGEIPGLFNPRFWHGLMLDWAMRDAGFKTDLFRFVDVFPTLQTQEQVIHHLRAYLVRDGRRLPVPIALALKAATHRWTSGVGAWAIRRNITDMAHRFIIGEDAGAAFPGLTALRRDGIAFTADLLGEATLSQADADAVQNRYMMLIDRLASEVVRWPVDPLLDRNHLGAIPRANVSLKLSALDPNLDPADRAAAAGRLVERVLPLFLRARERGVFINVDMEQWALHDIIYEVFEQVALHPALRDWPHLGVVIQAYLRTARRDAERLVELARRRGAPLTVRLVKGAYWDAEVVRSRQFGYPCPVFTEKAQSDLNYELLSTWLLENVALLQPAFGSHNLRSIAHAIVRAQRLGLPENAYEIQMLYGMAEPERLALRAMGRRVRAYTPIGKLLPGMAYFVRRLLENTANTSFLRLSYHEHLDLKTLLAPPQPHETENTSLAVSVKNSECGMRNAESRRQESGVRRQNNFKSQISNFKSSIPQSAIRAPQLRNCPLTDFTDPARVAGFSEAMARVGAALPLQVPVVVAGREHLDRQIMSRRCPSETAREAAAVRLATTADADEAVQAAMAAYPAWRDLPLETRCGLLETLAGRLDADRPALAALETWEVAKPWHEADADVAEAIDFCRYYAAQARLELAPRPLGDVPGEENMLHYEGRGPTVVIAPWNFPLAILCGMSVAALVAGNPVLLKPAEQSSAVAHAFYRHLVQAGFPPEVIHFLPGVGEVVGRHLVEHPLVAQIAFTGSRFVGLQIMEQAARRRPGQPQVKRIVCEMGGKNAIIIDEDADLDDAVAGVVRSAFDYAGQKCSACSRAILVGALADAFIPRLVEVVRSLPAGPAHLAGVRLGPVVDDEAYRRLMDAIENPGRGASLIYRGPAIQGGWFVPPAIFEVRDERHRLMQEELFGPVLALYRVPTFEEALRVANGTDYALTGGVFSRDPGHLDLARARFRVGNLYLNRAITGAAVGRQPFGGFAMSGVGAKAGGPDYLVQFAQPRCVTENTTRHGFTPDV